MPIELPEQTPQLARIEGAGRAVDPCTTHLLTNSVIAEHRPTCVLCYKSLY